MPGDPLPKLWHRSDGVPFVRSRNLKQERDDEMEKFENFMDEQVKLILKS